MNKPKHYTFAGHLEPYIFSNYMAKPVGVAFDYIWRLAHKDTAESNIEKALNTLAQIENDACFIEFPQRIKIPSGVLGRFPERQAMALEKISFIDAKDECSEVIKWLEQNKPELIREAGQQKQCKRQVKAKQ